MEGSAIITARRSRHFFMWGLLAVRKGKICAVLRTCKTNIGKPTQGTHAMGQDSSGQQLRFHFGPQENKAIAFIANL
jgi:hypothetical protein